MRWIAVSLAIVAVAGCSGGNETPSSARASWVTEIQRTVPGRNAGQEVEDPGLVRSLREAAGASATVGVEVKVFEAGGEHAPAVTLRPDHLLTYLGRGEGQPGYNRVFHRLERSKTSIWLLEIYDVDEDLVFTYAKYAPDGDGAIGARRDIEACFYTVSLDPGPPCPIHFSK